MTTTDLAPVLSTALQKIGLLVLQNDSLDNQLKTANQEITTLKAFILAKVEEEKKNAPEDDPEPKEEAPTE